MLCSGHKQQQVVATEGRDRCDFKLDQPVPHDQNKINGFEAKQKPHNHPGAFHVRQNRLPTGSSEEVDTVRLRGNRG